jgi:hypothetical protein
VVLVECLRSLFPIPTKIGDRAELSDQFLILRFKEAAMLANQIPRARIQLNLDWYTHVLVGDKEHKASVVYSIFHDLSVATDQAHSHNIEAAVAYPTAGPETIFPSTSRQVSPGMRSSRMILTVATTTCTSTAHCKMPASLRILRNEANEVARLSHFIVKSDSMDLPMRDTALFEKGDRGYPGTHAPTALYCALAHPPAIFLHRQGMRIRLTDHNAFRLTQKINDRLFGVVRSYRRSHFWPDHSLFVSLAEEYRPHGALLT